MSPELIPHFTETFRHKQIHVRIYIRASTYEMGSFVLLQFALFIAHIMGGRNACESDVDCLKTTQNATHCCREFDIKSNLDCHVVSCVGLFCEDDAECGGLCCISNNCTRCSRCLSSDECNEEEVCCGKYQVNEYGTCRGNCLGLRCSADEQCAGQECCGSQGGSKTCVNGGNCVFRYIFIAVVMGLCLIFLIVVVAYVLSKFKRTAKRRRTVAPVKLGMNGTCTVLTMPTTCPCTSNRTALSSQNNN